eukprot:gene23600-biopygen13382
MPSCAVGPMATAESSAMLPTTTPRTLAAGVPPSMQEEQDTGTRGRGAGMSCSPRVYGDSILFPNLSQTLIRDKTSHNPVESKKTKRPMLQPYPAPTVAGAPPPFPRRTERHPSRVRRFGGGGGGVRTCARARARALNTGRPFRLALVPPPGKTGKHYNGMPGGNGCGRVPDASHTVECEETDASSAVSPWVGVASPPGRMVMQGMQRRQGAQAVKELGRGGADPRRGAGSRFVDADGLGDVPSHATRPTPCAFAHVLRRNFDHTVCRCASTSTRPMTGSSRAGTSITATSRRRSGPVARGEQRVFGSSGVPQAPRDAQGKSRDAAPFPNWGND